MDVPPLVDLKEFEKDTVVVLDTGAGQLEFDDGEIFLTVTEVPEGMPLGALGSFLA